MQARKAALTGGQTGPHVASKERRRAPEWITVQLDEVALVRTIGFGKTTKGAVSPSPLVRMSALAQF